MEDNRARLSGLLPLYALFVAIALTISVPASVFAQQFQAPATAKLQKSQLPAHLRKLDTALYQAWQTVGVLPGKSTVLSPVLKMDTQHRAHITLRVYAITDALLQQLTALGFELEASTQGLPISANLHSIVGWASLAQLDAIARLPAIFHIRPTLEPILHTGSVNSAGDSILGAAQLRASIGVSGSGQTVGVLSDGVDHLGNAQASGDLPASVGVLSNTLGCLAAGTDCSCPTNTPNCDVKDEGTAMLEIVHDLAPGAQLLFSDAGASPEAFAQRILGLRNAGSSIIVDDIGWFGSPYYEDGIIAQTINSVTLNNDIAYFSSAGNQALEHYESFFNDTSGNGFHEFSAGDDSLGFILPAGATAVVFLQWNNKWGSANDDYDLLIADQNFQILAESTNTQNGTGDPFEVTGIVNTSDSEMLFNIGVKKFAGADREFTILLRNASAQEYISAGGITGHQAAEHCLAIGTINAQDAATNDIAPYSSQGPSRIYSYDGAGNPVGFTDRLKPDLTAIDGVLVTGAGGFGVADPNGSSNRLFFGTSAAAPHAAAIAALVRAAAPQLSATQVAQVLRSTALDIGTAGFDFVSGSGRIDALASVQQVCPVCFQSSGSS
ncbi:MAG: S8 family serine peptidase, partial [Gammaproteobacteria bacterium]